MTMHRMSIQKACFLSESTDNLPKPADLKRLLERVSTFNFSPKVIQLLHLMHMSLSLAEKEKKKYDFLFKKLSFGYQHVKVSRTISFSLFIQKGDYSRFLVLYNAVMVSFSIS